MKTQKTKKTSKTQKTSKTPKLPPRKTEKQLKAELWKLFSLYIRKSNEKNGLVECYTCGKRLLVKEAQAGHGISGRSNAILFEEDIVRPQCSGCNIFKGGSYDVFIPKLIREIGQDRYEDLVRLKGTPVKRTHEWYIEQAEKYKKLLEGFFT